MAKLNTLFDTFLSNIEPDPEAVEYAQLAHEPVREYLKKDEEFGQYVENTFLYGSYKRHTAVGDIKDVDIVVLTNFDVTDPENSPNKVLRRLKEALARYYKNPENTEYQRRSIRVDQPLPKHSETAMTLDIIPAVAVRGEDYPLQVPDREVQEWIQSHPKGHLKHTTDLNRDEYSKGWFVPLVKTMKWWWKYQCETNQPDVERPKPKGFWVECLTAENFDPLQDDLGSHFVATLTNISQKYSNSTVVPELADPGLPGEVIRTSMELDEFQVFMDTVTESLAKAQQAQDETDELESSQLWRDVFGDQFPLYNDEETDETRAAAKAMLLGSSSHAKPLPWHDQTKNKFKVRIDARTYTGNKQHKGLNPDRAVLPSGVRLRFEAKVKVSSRDEIWWRVVNTGKHAMSQGCPRGDFFRSKQPDGSLSEYKLVTWESTQYTGKHWIECFIVRDGFCVARSKRFYVNIRNPEWPG